MRRYHIIDDRKYNINFQNLNLLDKKLACLSESRIAMIHELALASSNELESHDDVIEALGTVYKRSVPQKCTPDALSDFCAPELISKYINCISVFEKVELCRDFLTLSKCTPKKLIDVILSSNELQSPEALSPHALGKIAYIKNNYTEAAFMKFSRMISSPRSSYLSSFNAACEEVYSGESEFCILPIESSSEGRLNSFYSMIDRYELKIAAVCTVEHRDSQYFTSFALLKKSISELTVNKAAQKERRFEFRFPVSPTAASPLSDILCAAEACNMSLFKIDSFTLPYSEDLLSYYVTFNIRGAELATFLLYLFLEFPQCYPIGVYFLLK